MHRLANTPECLPRDEKGNFDYRLFLEYWSEFFSKFPHNALQDPAELYEVIFNKSDHEVLLKYPKAKHVLRHQRVLGGAKKFNCERCFQVNTNKQTKHAPDCLGSKDPVRFPLLKLVDRRYICLLCLRTYLNKRRLLVHYLQHSFNELRWLGVHPFTLRKLIPDNNN